MKKRILFSLLAVFWSFLLTGCKEDKVPENVSTVTVIEKPTVDMASVPREQEEAVRLQEAKSLPSGETYGIKYNLKINPELDIYADDDLLIVAVQALNADAKDLLENIDIVGMDVTSAVDYVVSESRTRGYMTEEKGNTVELTILEINETVMKECAECGGCGTVLCEDCHGTPFFTCQSCGGEKRHVCEYCGGIGQNGEGDEVIGDIPCRVCDGNIWVTCEVCNGTGRGPLNCSHCNGSGACNACSGSGYIDVTAGDGPDVGKVIGTDACYRCHGSGICQNCKGESDTYCPNCCEHNGPDGSIRNPGGTPGKMKCIACNGTGIEEHRENSANNVENCEYCNGAGYFICESCDGTGGSWCSCELNGYRWCGSCHGSGIQIIEK